MLTEEQIERECIRQVFSLSDELNDTPYTYQKFVRDLEVHEEAFKWVAVLVDRVFLHWYEGVPEWAARDLGYFDRGSSTVDQKDCQVPPYTVIYDCLFGKPAAPLGFTEIACYHSSGETACQWCGEGTEWDGSEAQVLVGEKDPTTNTGYRGNPACPLCEGSGYIYLGAGWCELVFAPDHVGRDAMITQVANTFLAHAWITGVELCLENGQGPYGEDISGVPSMSGRDLTEVIRECTEKGLWCAPSQTAVSLSVDQAREEIDILEDANALSIAGMYACAKRGQEMSEQKSWYTAPEQTIFAYYIATELLGTGVVWSDNHPEHGYEVHWAECAPIEFLGEKDD